MKRLKLIFLTLSVVLFMAIMSFDGFIPQSNLNARAISEIAYTPSELIFPDEGDIWWVTPPVDQRVEFGQPFEYNLAANSINPLDNWWLNDTTNFSINSTGSITNATSLSMGSYGIHVWVNDTLGNELNSTFKVTVTEFDEWTVLVYLDGDNDLEEHAFNDLNSMEKIGSTSDVRIIVFVDFWLGFDAPFTGGQCYEVTQDSDLSTINSLQLTHPFPSEPNMGNWQTLRDFILFGQAYAPSRNYLLVIWDHGLGCESVCIDETNSDYLTMREIQQALAAPQIDYLDIVAFDACLMAQIEVAYELRDTTDYLVFSEEGVPLNGFPYEDIFTNLTLWPTSNPFTVAEGLPSYYVSAYDVGGRYYDALIDWACLSAIDTSKVDEIVTNLQQLALELYSQITSPGVYERICLSRYIAQGFSRADFVDIIDFASALSLTFADSAYPSIPSLATNLSEAVEAAIIHEEHLSGVSDAHGLAIVLNRYIDSYDFADDTIWDTFMNVFTDVGSEVESGITIPASGEYFGYLDWVGDSVYFVYTPSMTGLCFISMEGLLIEYYTDFDLYVYDNYENTIGSSTSATSSEAVTIMLTEGRTYYIEVYSYPGETDGIGVFQLTIQQGSTIIIPPSFELALIALGAFAFIVVPLVIIIYLVKRRPSLPVTPPYRYTSPPTTPAQQPETMKFCAYCGALLPAQARYCPVCGAST